VTIKRSNHTAAQVKTILLFDSAHRYLQSSCEPAKLWVSDMARGVQPVIVAQASPAEVASPQFASAFWLAVRCTIWLA